MNADREEQARVAALRSYGLLDTPNEPAFDRIVLETKQALGMPIVLISLVDANRQWFKAKIGIEAAQIPLSISFCTHAIKGRDVLVIPDAKLDERFADNPLVTGNPLVRFYAGTPLIASNNRRIGTLCVLDTRPHRDFGSSAAAILTANAAATMTAVEARARLRGQAAA